MLTAIIKFQPVIFYRVEWFDAIKDMLLFWII